MYTDRQASANSVDLDEESGISSGSRLFADMLSFEK